MRLPFLWLLFWQFHSASPLKLPQNSLAQLIERIDQRARFLGRLAFLYLVMIVLLIFLAFVVFWKAPDITFSDLSNTSGKAEENLKKQENGIEAAQENIVGSMALLIEPLQRGLSDFSTSTPGVSPAVLGRLSIKVDEKADLMSYSDLGKLLQQDIDPIPTDQANRKSFDFPTGYGVNIGGNLPAEDWKRVSNKLSSLKMPIDDKHFAHLNEMRRQKFSLDAQDDRVKRLLEEIQKGDIAREAARLSGTTVNDDISPTSPNVRLIQTSVTRFGTLTILLFLVGIISGLYRYSSRLQGFYYAKADSLLALMAQADAPVLDALSSVLTPTIEFGKAPSTPIEQVAQIAEAIAKIGRKGGD